MLARTIVIFALLSASLTIVFARPTIAQSKSTYIGNLLLKDVKNAKDDHTFELGETFSFRDKKGRLWTAPQGTQVNGASIPGFFWSFIGGPWSGKFKYAAVIHDHFCVTKSRPWQDVHQVFFDAMIVSGVSKLKAKLMYYAVYRYGPRWTDTEKHFSACLAGYSSRDIRASTKGRMNIDHAIVPGACFASSSYSTKFDWQAKLDEAEARVRTKEILAKNPSLEAIRTMADQSIQKNSVYDSFYTYMARQNKYSGGDLSLDGRFSALKELGLVK